MSDSVGIYALIAAVCLIFGAQGYLAILYILFYRNGRKPMFTRREAMYLCAILFCAAGIFTIVAVCSQTTMAHLSAAFGASTMTGAAARHCWAFRRAFAKPVK
ncbi:MAG: hypothetical protein ABI431_08395 [Candidatus Tumulicola sp.]